MPILPHLSELHKTLGFAKHNGKILDDLLSTILSSSSDNAMVMLR